MIRACAARVMAACAFVMAVVTTDECVCATYGKRYCPIHHEELRPPT